MPRPLTEVNDNDFDALVLQAKGPVLVDFWAPWCTACKPLIPILESLAEDLGEAARIVKLNTEAAPATAERLGVRGLPTCIVFVDGVEKTRLPGVHGKQRFRALIEASTKQTLSAEDTRAMAAAALEATFISRDLAEAARIAREHPEILSADSEDQSGMVGRAVLMQSPELAEVLAEHAPRLNHRELAALGRADALDLWLREHRSVIADVPGMGFTALAFSAMRGDVPATRVLLAAGFSPDTPSRLTDNGMTPLVLAVGRKHSEVARLLIEAGADVSAKMNHTGGTLLHAAVMTGEAAMLELLQGASGIDPQAVDNNGKTAVDLAREARRDDLVLILTR